MSMIGGAPKEHGETIATFTSYEAAQKAVSQLIEADIPAKDISIVGRGLRSVETVTGRLGYAAAARTGAINGVLLGLLFSVIFVLGNPSAQVQHFLGIMLVGIALGMLMSIIMYSIVRRRRDYTSITQMIADSYEVSILDRSLVAARQKLRGAPMAPPAPPAIPTEAPLPQPAATPEVPSTPDVREPPRYGERIDPATPQQPHTNPTEH